MPMTLTPIERTLLSSCDCWRSVSELQADLIPEFPEGEVPPALDLMRHAGWLETMRPKEDSPIFYSKRTGAGTRVLRRDERRQVEAISRELSRPAARARMVIAR